MLAVKNGEMCQMGITVTQQWYIYSNRVFHNKILKGGIAACYETWIYELL